MDCLNECLHVVPAEDAQDEYENPILTHWQVSEAGYNYYFCATHRTLHCMASDTSLDQPYCGECAPYYYYGYSNVVWIKDRDRVPKLENARQRAVVAARELIALNLNLPARRMDDGQGGLDDSGSDNSETSSSTRSTRSTRSILESLLSLPSASNFPENGNGNEIPRDDITYQGLGDFLIGHPRQRGLFRLPFRDYQGSVGYMPCGLDIDRRPTFMHLAQCEERGDPIFKSARAWACKYQGIPVLSRDIRWVLWNIYMVCNEVLYDCNETEESIWKWRGWLWYLYRLANELFAEHQIDVVSPEEDWFRRPAARYAPVRRPSNEEDEDDILGGQNNTPATSTFGSPTDLLDLPPPYHDGDDNTDLSGSVESQETSEISPSETVSYHE
ncbi:hypothetical protein V8C37DRAFT_414583 [Trichoderma ceciliae]